MSAPVRHELALEGLRRTNYERHFIVGNCGLLLLCAALLLCNDDVRALD